MYSIIFSWWWAVSCPKHVETYYKWNIYLLAASSWCSYLSLYDARKHKTEIEKEHFCLWFIILLLFKYNEPDNGKYSLSLPIWILLKNIIQHTTFSSPFSPLRSDFCDSRFNVIWHRPWCSFHTFVPHLSSRLAHRILFLSFPFSISAPTDSDPPSRFTNGPQLVQFCPAPRKSG